MISTIALLIGLMTSSNNELLPVQNHSIPEIFISEDDAGVSFFTDSASASGYWRKRLGSKEETDSVMQTFDFTRYDYIKVAYILSHGNNGVNYKVERDTNQKMVTFSYQIINFGYAPSRGMLYKEEWLKIEKQSGFTYQYKPTTTE